MSSGKDEVSDTESFIDACQSLTEELELELDQHLDDYGYSNTSQPVLLEPSDYTDCDAELEKVLRGFELEDDGPNCDSKSTSSRRKRLFQFLRARHGMEYPYNNVASPTNPIPNSYSFRSLDGAEYGASVDGQGDNLDHLDPEERARLTEEWKTELAKTEEEIQTLRQVLSAKVRHSHELKRKLGISVWKEFQTDVEQGLKNVKESTYYQKTSQVLNNAGEKTTSAIAPVVGSIRGKLDEARNSTTYKSFEEKFGSAYSNVKTRVYGTRSTSMVNFEEALNNSESRGNKSVGGTPAATPMIPEDKVLK